MHPLEDAFLLALEADPSDALSRLAYADWLEEQGYDARAACLRWTARAGKRPSPANIKSAGACLWWAKDDPSVLSRRPEISHRHRLPEALYRATAALSDDEDSGASVYFRTRRDAELALQAAWESTPLARPE